MCIDLMPLIAKLGKDDLDDEYEEKRNEVLTGKDKTENVIPNLKHNGNHRFYDIELEKFFLENEKTAFAKK